LPLVCGECKHNFEKEVSCDEMFVECPSCGSRKVRVLSPVKILDLVEAKHYNKSSSEARNSPEETEGVLRVDFARFFEETEIVEEVVL